MPGQAGRLRTARQGERFPSLLLSARQLVGAEWLWRERWLGRVPGGFPQWVLEPTLYDLRQRLRAVEVERAQYIASLPEGAASSMVAFKLMNGTEDQQPVDVMVRHVVNHGSYHRGQIAAFIRQLGVKPPSTDLIAFARQRSTA